RDEAMTELRAALKARPNDAALRNNMAWALDTSADARLRDPGLAVELALRAVELAPNQGTYWNTLGVAHYWAGNWGSAIEALEKSMSLRHGGDSYEWFFLAMACWQLKRPDD